MKVDKRIARTKVLVQTIIHFTGRCSYQELILLQTQERNINPGIRILQALDMNNNKNARAFNTELSFKLSKDTKSKENLFCQEGQGSFL